MVRIASYNVRNLFDDYTRDGSSAPKPEREVKALVKAIERLRADVIGVQEVESLKALKEVNERLDGPFEYVRLKKGNSSRGIHLGFLSRFPITLTSHRTQVLTYANGRPMHDFASQEAAERGETLPLLFQRDALVAKVNLGGGRKIGILNLHLKSQRDYPWMKHRASEVRAAEARAAKRIIKDASGQIDIVLGDFNEEADKWPIEPILGGLPVLDPVEEDLGAQGRSAFTYHPFRYRGRIDYLLPIGPFRTDYVKGSVKIHDSKNNRTASDHLPLSSDFAFET
jgi:endonuclease/exonuclease/phosphatase family metal-dependent hydrolase